MRSINSQHIDAVRPIQELKVSLRDAVDHVTTQAVDERKEWTRRSKSSTSELANGTVIWSAQIQRVARQNTATDYVQLGAYWGLDEAMQGVLICALVVLRGSCLLSFRQNNGMRLDDPAARLQALPWGTDQEALWLENVAGKDAALDKLHDGLLRVLDKLL